MRENVRPRVHNVARECLSLLDWARERGRGRRTWAVSDLSSPRAQPPKHRKAGAPRSGDGGDEKSTLVSNPTHGTVPNASVGAEDSRWRGSAAAGRKESRMFHGKRGRLWSLSSNTGEERPILDKQKLQK